MEKFTSTPIYMLLASVMLGSFGQVFLKKGMNMQRAVADGGTALSGAFRSLANPYVLLGFALYGISSIIWLMILKKLNLSVAYPMISMSYVFVVILSRLFFGDRITIPTVVGLALICSGVALIGTGLAHAGGK